MTCISNTYCGVFLFWFSLSFVPYVASFSALSFIDLKYCSFCIGILIQYFVFYF